MRLTYKKDLTVGQVIRAAQLLNLPTPIVNEEEYYAYVDKEIYEAYAKYIRSITSSWTPGESYLTATLTNAQRIIADICGAYQDKVDKYESSSLANGLSIEDIRLYFE